MSNCEVSRVNNPSGDIPKILPPLPPEKTREEIIRICRLALSSSGKVPTNLAKQIVVALSCLKDPAPSLLKNPPKISRYGFSQIESRYNEGGYEPLCKKIQVWMERSRPASEKRKMPACNPKAEAVVELVSFSLNGNFPFAVIAFNQGVSLATRRLSRKPLIGRDNVTQTALTGEALRSDRPFVEIAEHAKNIDTCSNPVSWTDFDPELQETFKHLKNSPQTPRKREPKMAGLKSFSQGWRLLLLAVAPEKVKSGPFKKDLQSAVGVTWNRSAFVGNLESLVYYLRMTLNLRGLFPNRRLLCEHVSAGRRTWCITEEDVFTAVTVQITRWLWQSSCGFFSSLTPGMRNKVPYYEEFVVGRFTSRIGASVEADPVVIGSVRVTLTQPPFLTCSFLVDNFENRPCAEIKKQARLLNKKNPFGFIYRTRKNRDISIRCEEGEFSGLYDFWGDADRVLDPSLPGMPSVALKGGVLLPRNFFYKHGRPWLETMESLSMLRKEKRPNDRLVFKHSDLFTQIQKALKRGSYRKILLEMGACENPQGQGTLSGFKGKVRIPEVSARQPMDVAMDILLKNYDADFILKGLDIETFVGLEEGGRRIAEICKSRIEEKYFSKGNILIRRFFHFIPRFKDANPVTYDSSKIKSAGLKAFDEFRFAPRIPRLLIENIQQFFMAGLKPKGVVVIDIEILHKQFQAFCRKVFLELFHTKNHDKRAFRDTSSKGIKEYPPEKMTDEELEVWFDWRGFKLLIDCLVEVLKSQAE